MGKLLVAIGLIVAFIGVLMMLGVPFGRLPLDVTYRRGNFSFYLPLGTSIVISVVLTLLFTLLLRR